MAKRKAATEQQDGNAAEMVGGGEDVGLIAAGPGRCDGFRNEPLTRRANARLYGEWLKIMAGQSAREVPAKDWRFADPTWREHPIYKRTAQGYLAFCDAVDKVVDDNPDWRKRERARFLTGILTTAMAPTNTLIGNPAALKKAYETGGASLVRGARNLIGDLRTNKGMPTQVKRSDFKLGQNLAATPGAVVLRTERLELLQYQPTTDKVYEIPTLIIPPPIGKHYFIDLSPGRSFVEYAVAKGFQMFCITWRNPQKEQGDWSIDDYIRSMLEAVDAVCRITGSKKVNLSGFCAGGIMTTLMLSYMAAVRDNRVNAAAFGVMLLDFDTEAPIGALHSRKLIGIARKRSQKQGIHPAVRWRRCSRGCGPTTSSGTTGSTTTSPARTHPASTSSRGAWTAPICRASCTRSSSISSKPTPCRRRAA
jgi:polyhydroxyalkanoate synthase